MTGVSGRRVDRGADVTANGRSRSALICSIVEVIASNITFTRPPKRSVSAGPELRSGTCVIAIPVMILNKSRDMRLDAAIAGGAPLSLRGLAMGVLIETR